MNIFLRSAPIYNFLPRSIQSTSLYVVFSLNVALSSSDTALPNLDPFYNLLFYFIYFILFYLFYFILFIFYFIYFIYFLLFYFI